jgi:hypothetical protein
MTATGHHPFFSVQRLRQFFLPDRCFVANALTRANDDSGSTEQASGTAFNVELRAAVLAIAYSRA